MYVLLNLKDEKMLQNVVQLLFSHGHRQLSIGETIENLCPTCEKSAALSAAVTETTTPEFLCSTPIKTEKQNSHSLKRTYNNISPIMSNACDLRYEDISVKEEPSDEGNDVQDFSGELDETETFSLSQALELFEHSKTLTEGIKPTKRIKNEEPFGEIFQCQLCKKSISRHGQYANLLNHLSRHARLHASKKQYCCPSCGASFTRRYLAAAHIKEAHNDADMQPHDFAAELREEYKSLLEVCFPGADSRRRQQQVVTQMAKDTIMSILSDDSGISLPDGGEITLDTSNMERNVIEVHVGSDNTVLRDVNEEEQVVS